jgi:hypothetical protein
MNEEYENERSKRERGRSRVRSLKLSKKNRNRKRSGSEDGKLKIGNTRTVGFCSWCRPSLANRILNKKSLDINFETDLDECLKDVNRSERDQDRDFLMKFSMNRVEYSIQASFGKERSKCNLYDHVASVLDTSVNRTITRNDISERSSFTGVDDTSTISSHNTEFSSYCLVKINRSASSSSVGSDLSLGSWEDI